MNAPKALDHLLLTVSSYLVFVILIVGNLLVCLDCSSAHIVVSGSSSRATTTTTTSNTTYCDRKWPELTLFVPVGLRQNSSRNQEWSDVFLHSMAMFWPKQRSNTSLLIVLDKEVEGSDLQQVYVNSLIERVSNIANFPHVGIKYHTKNITYKIGHDRQQHMMFYADRFVDSKFVGFGDTDCMFYTYVDREDLFEEGKPVVHGRIGHVKKRERPTSQWPTTTYHVLGMEQPMICMSYFPVIVHTLHMKALRLFVEAKHNLPFDEVFLIYLSGRSFSQFNIMCTYLFNTHKEDYKWYVHDTSPWWDGLTPEPLFGQWSEKWIFNHSMFAWKPFISTHVRYASRLNTSSNIEKLFVRGLCNTAPIQNHLGLNCSTYLKTITHFDEMHTFEDVDYAQLGANITEMHNMQRIRRKRFHGCDLSYGKEAWDNFFSHQNYALQDYEKLLMS